MICPICGATEKPARERWLQLKNLSHRIGLEENPDPMWEHLKTQIVREEFQDCKFWGMGPSRSMLCEHALQTFVAKDQRGRSVVSSENIRIALAP